MTFAVVPVVFSFYQVLLVLLPALLMMLGSAIIALFKPSTFKKSVRLFWRLKIPLLIGAAGVYGCVWAVRSLWPAPVAAKAESTSADWSQFRGGPKRTGAVPGAPPPLAGGINWSFKGDLHTFYSSPTVVGNRIYCTGSFKSPLGTDKGAVFCLDADTGALVWEAAPDKFRATFSSPSVSGKYLVVGEGLHEIRDARIFCLDIEHSGKVLWSHTTANHVESTACIAGDRVCIGAGDDGYYCFALEPAADRKPKLLWHAEHAKYPDAETSPAFHDGKFFVGLGLRGNALVCIDAKTGAEAWRVTAPYPVFAPPTITNGKLLIGMGNGNFIENAEQASLKELGKLKAEGASASQLAEAAERLKAGGEVWSIDLASPTHEVLWKYKVAEVVLGAVAAVEDGKLYFGARDGFLYALSAEGKELGRWDARAPIMASPSVAGDFVYVVTENGKVYGLNRHTMKPEWDAALGGGTPVISSPAVARGHLYLGSMGEGLRCIGVPAESAARAAWAGALGGPGKPGHLGQTEPPDRGSVIWRWPGDGAETPKIAAPVAILDDLICVPIADGAKRGVVALENDPAAASMPATRWQFQTANGVWLSPAIVPASKEKEPATVFVSDGKRGDAKRQLSCLEGAKGAVRWQVPVEPDALGEFSVLGDCVVVSSGAKELACFALDGKPRWKRPVGTVSGAVANQHDLGIIATSAPPKLTAIDLPSGRDVWSVDVPATTGAAVENNIVYVGAQNGVRAFKLIDGSPVWNTESAAPAQPLLLLEGRLATVTGTGEVLLLDSKTGTIITKLSDANAAFPALLTREAVYFAGKELMRCAAEATSAQRWMTAARLGTISAPPVSANSCIFFATETRGLIKAGKLK